MASCPIACGDCCELWSQVPDLWRRRNPGTRPTDECPNLGSQGCRLPRNRRPKACLNYLCSRALAWGHLH